MYAKVEISGVIEVVTGMHIGGIKCVFGNWCC